MTTLSVAMETSGRIWPNFELIQASMHVLIACKYEMDQMKNSSVIFSIISLWDFFQTLKGSQLRGPWSDLAEFRTHSSSYIYNHYLQVWNESDQKRSRKCDGTVFTTVTLSVAMETSGRIWPNFELIQALIHVLITCKYVKDPIKNSGENVMTSFSPL